MSGPLGALRPAVSGSVADWVFGSLHAFDEFDVGIVIPPGFDAYACLLHSGQSDDHQVRGCPRIEDIRPLVDVLRSATSTPGSCWFCIWNGWGWLHVSAGAIAQVGPERPGWRDPLVEVEQLAASTPLVGDQYRQYHLSPGRSMPSSTPACRECRTRHRVCGGPTIVRGSSHRRSTTRGRTSAARFR